MEKTLLSGLTPDQAHEVTMELLKIYLNNPNSAQADFALPVNSDKLSKQLARLYLTLRQNLESGLLE